MTTTAYIICSLKVVYDSALNITYKDVNMKNIRYVSFIMMMVIPIDAFAYLDPGTGSIIIQSAIASIAAAGYIIKIYWYKIITWFSRKKETSLAEDVIDDKK